MTEASMTNQPEAKPRAEIHVSTKGVYTWDVKAYGDTPEDAVAKAIAMNDAMLARYGKPGGGE